MSANEIYPLSLEKHLNKLFEICYGQALFERHKESLNLHIHLKFDTCKISVSKQYDDEICDIIQSHKISFYNYFVTLVIIICKVIKTSHNTDKDKYIQTHEHLKITISQFHKETTGIITCTLDKVNILNNSTIWKQIKEKFLYNFNYRFFLCQIIIFILTGSFVMNWSNVTLFEHVITIYKLFAIVFLLIPFIKLINIFLETISKIQLYYKQDYLYSRYSKYQIKDNNKLFNNISNEPIFSDLDDELLIGIFVEEFYSMFIPKSFSMQKASTIILDMKQGQGKSSFINLLTNKINFNGQGKFHFWKSFVHGVTDHNTNIVDIDMAYISNISISKNDSFFQILHDTIVNSLGNKFRRYIKQLTNSLKVDFKYIKFDLNTNTNTEMLKRDLARSGKKYIIILNDYERLPDNHRKHLTSLLLALSNVPMLMIILPTEYQKFNDEIIKFEKGKNSLAKPYDLINKIIYNKFEYSKQYYELIGVFISNEFNKQLNIAKLVTIQRNRTISLKHIISSFYRDKASNKDMSIREIQSIIPKINFSGSHPNIFHQFYYYFTNYRNDANNKIEIDDCDVENDISKYSAYQYFIIDLFCISIPKPQQNELIDKQKWIINNFWLLFVNESMLDLIIQIRGGNDISRPQLMPTNTPLNFDLNNSPLHNKYITFFKYWSILTENIKHNLLLDNVIRYNILFVYIQLLKEEQIKTDDITDIKLKQIIDNENQAFQLKIDDLNNKLQLQNQRIKAIKNE